MREIKFRAISISYLPKGQWHYFRIRDLLNIDSESWYDEKTLSQFIGLKDKNGKEIYEGDIIFSNQCNKGVVKWFNKLVWDGSGSLHPGFYCNEWFDYLKDNDMNFHSGFDDAEVIGNIYENPELLKV